MDTNTNEITIINVPIGAPRERHTRCGDLIEFDYAWDADANDGRGNYRYDADGEIAVEPACKTCGAIPANEIEIS